MRAIYPGSFDPLTWGHLDMIQRAAAIFDELIVLIMTNPDKKGWFTLAERAEMLKRCTGQLDNVSVVFGSGITVNEVKRLKGTVMIRGIRDNLDCCNEFLLAAANQALDPDVETLFLKADNKYAYLSSSMAKQAALCGADLKAFVPDCAAEMLQKRATAIKNKDTAI